MSLAERGVSIIELLWLEDLAADRIHKFAFIAAPLKLRGVTGSPMRPLVIPVRSSHEGLRAISEADACCYKEW